MTFIQEMEAEYSLIMFSDWSQDVLFAKLNNILKYKMDALWSTGIREGQADSGPQ